jgi:hypothetical protein
MVAYSISAARWLGAFALVCFLLLVARARFFHWVSLRNVLAACGWNCLSVVAGVLAALLPAVVLKFFVHRPLGQSARVRATTARAGHLAQSRPREPSHPLGRTEQGFAGAPLPDFVRAELENYLGCGLLQRVFALVELLSDHEEHGAACSFMYKQTPLRSQSMTATAMPSSQAKGVLSSVGEERIARFSYGTRDLTHAALLEEQALGAHVVAAEIDRDVRLAALRAGARRRLGQGQRGIDSRCARGGAHAEVGAVVHVLVEPAPGAAARAVGFVDPQLLLHAAVGEVIDGVPYTRSAQIRPAAFFWAPVHRQLATDEPARQTLLCAMREGSNQLRTRLLRLLAAAKSRRTISPLPSRASHSVKHLRLV